MPISAADRDKRIDFVIANLGTTMPSKLAHVIMARFDIKERAARDWITKARAICRELYYKSREEMVLEAASVIDRIRYDKDTPPRIVLQANKQMASLFGLNQPLKFDHNIHDGGDDKDNIEAMKDPVTRKMHFDLMARIAGHNSK